MILKGQRNQCRGCNEYFNSNLAFDKHRTGHHGHDRRCMTVEEMLAKGMLKNSRGFWITEAYDRTIWRDQDDEKADED